MEGTGIDKLEKIILKNQTMEIEGQTFGQGSFHVIRNIDRADPINGKSLTGLIDYIKANRDGLQAKELFLQVDSFGKVTLFSTLEASDLGRTVYFRAELDKELPVFRFEQYISIEEFIIKTRALFAHTPDLDVAIATISKVTNLNASEISDDGLAQNVSVTRGVSGAVKDSASTKGIYTLAPYRTFRELKQPESKFILRLSAASVEAAPTVALFDSEGEIWRHNAVQDIKNWLIENLDGIDIPVIA